ncbi:hypothetical protein FQA39_LY09083 [Lamprigera yunnana]|nr:hypothetical protein FQA39_LY09083 [Lamprigera yunnana]
MFVQLRKSLSYADTMKRLWKEVDVRDTGVTVTETEKIRIASKKQVVLKVLDVDETVGRNEIKEAIERVVGKEAKKKELFKVIEFGGGAVLYNNKLYCQNYSVDFSKPKFYDTKATPGIKSKKRAFNTEGTWKMLLENLHIDVRRNGYRIVTGKLKGGSGHTMSNDDGRDVLYKQKDYLEKDRAGRILPRGEQGGVRRHSDRNEWCDSTWVRRSPTFGS